MTLKVRFSKWCFKKFIVQNKVNNNIQLFHLCNVKMSKCSSGPFCLSWCIYGVRTDNILRIPNEILSLFITSWKWMKQHFISLMWLQKSRQMIPRRQYFKNQYVEGNHHDYKEIIKRPNNSSQNLTL